MRKQKNNVIFPLMYLVVKIKTPSRIYTSKETSEKHVHLLLLSNTTFITIIKY